MHGNAVGVSWLTPDRPIILRAYQFSLAMMVTVRPGMLASGDYSEVLFTARFNGLSDEGDFGAIVLPPSNAQVHGYDLESTMFCRVILKTWVNDPPIANAVNDIVTLSGLSIPVPPSTYLVMTAGHAGYGPSDFECQFAFFYDDLTGS